MVIYDSLHFLHLKTKSKKKNYRKCNSLEIKLWGGLFLFFLDNHY